MKTKTIRSVKKAPFFVVTTPLSQLFQPPIMGDIFAAVRRRVRRMLQQTQGRLMNSTLFCFIILVTASSLLFFSIIPAIFTDRLFLHHYFTHLPIVTTLTPASYRMVNMMVKSTSYIQLLLDRRRIHPIFRQQLSGRRDHHLLLHCDRLKQSSWRLLPLPRPRHHHHHPLLHLKQ